MTGEPTAVLDRELLDLPPELRMREWMMRVEAAVFASPKPVPRAVLAQLIANTVPLDDVIVAIQDELRTRPYELVLVGGGWQHRTRPRYGAMIRTLLASPSEPDLSKRDLELLCTIAFHQPVTRRRCEEILGRAISGDDVGRLRASRLISTGHRQAGPGAPYTLVTTDHFLEHFELASLGDLDAMRAQQDGDL